MANVELGTKAVGSIVKLKVNGTLREFIVVHQGLPSSRYDESCNGTWIWMNGYRENRKWHSSTVNDYANSDIHSYLNSAVLSMFDANIQAQIKQVKIPYRSGKGTSGAVRTGASGLPTRIFLLSAPEIHYTKDYIDNSEGDALAYFASCSAINNDGKRGLRIDDEIIACWLRSPYTGTDGKVWMVNGYGGCYDWAAIYSYGIRPALILPPSLPVSDDGSITMNTAPTTPPSITIPDTIQGGSTIDISWGASTDAENNLEGYIVERSIDGGTSWAQIYQGSATATRNTVAVGTQTGMYRVKGYDSEGLYSAYRTSSQITVINNTAPSAPASITVPNTIYGGQSTSITWGTATDPDGDAVTYVLERQIDGGDWAQVYTGANLSYTDSIIRGWTSVTYRVKAIDSRSASGPYTTSPTRTVNNNPAPTVICSQTSGADLGLKNTGFSVDYSATDPDGDGVTVTEAIDGEKQRSFQAVPDETYTFTISGETFMKVLNGEHTLTITASDGKADTVHRLLFQKGITSALITLVDAVPADARIAVCVLSVSGSIPADAHFKVAVTNNGMDADPVWEDCTNEVKTGTNHVFTNETQANGWAFNFKVTASRGPSGQGGYINSIQGGFQ